MYPRLRCTAGVNKGRYRRHQSGTIHLLLKHALKSEEAAAKFAEHDQRRFFARSPSEMVARAVTPFTHQPLQAHYLSYFMARVVVHQTPYAALYGIDRVYFTVDHKGRIVPHHRIDWYPTSGTLNGFTMDANNDHEMRLYAGSTVTQCDAEQALVGCDGIVTLCESYSAEKIDPGVTLDPMVKRKALAKQQLNDRVRQSVHTRIAHDVSRRHGNHVHVSSIEFVHMTGEPKLKSALVAFFLLRYPDHPVRLMTAFSSRHNVIIGTGPVSGLKVGLVNMALAIGVTSLVPCSLQARIIWTVGGWFSGLYYGAYRDGFRAIVQQDRINQEMYENEQIGETVGDRARREATRRIAWVATKNHNYGGGNNQPECRHFYVLGLDPSQTLTREMVLEAHLQYIWHAHPDVLGGSHCRAAEINTARDYLLCVITGSRE